MVNEFRFGEVVVETLEGLSQHAERGRWQGAALLLKTWRPWRSWPLEQSLATIDSDLNVHVAEFAVHPPPGWGTQPYELPPHPPLPKMLDRALAAPEALGLLNAILGDLRVIGDARFGANHVQSNFNKVPGIAPTWRFYSGFRGDSGAIRVDLGNDAYAEFDARMPTDGSPAEISVRWAGSYVVALRSLRIFGAALASPDLLAGMR